ncbi:CotH kinase family protein [Ancylomarina sp.]|uniref:CotH kinase family protein n=1 Tax=Ancylomarina sp. TaxID=1970196 RepID=UPI0035647A1B
MTSTTLIPAKEHKHNYFLYNDPATNLLTWIPWDNNEALQYGKQSGALSLSLSEVSSSWPLISYLTDDEDYKQVYKDYLLQFINEVFVPSKLSEAYTNYYNMIKDYAYAEESGYTYLRYDSEFDQAVETLKLHVQERNDAVNSYL